MNFHLTAFYYEVGVTFEISHKVFKLIRDRIRNDIFSKEKYLKLLPQEKNFTVQISAKKNVNEVLVKGPNSKSATIEFFIILPYNSIKESNDELIAFLDYLFTALSKIFEVCEFNIDKYLEKLKSEILNEVSGNQEYKYVDPMPWRKSVSGGKSDEK